MEARMSRQYKRLARRNLTEEQLRTSTWREPDIKDWSNEERQRYNRFKSAIIDYLAGEKVTIIENRYNIRISQIQEQVWRSLQFDGNDLPLGFCALISHLQVVETIRKKPLPTGMHPSASQCKGGLRHLLKVENLLEEFINKVLKRGKGPHPATVSPLEIQKWIATTLTERDYKKTDYPFNTRRPLYSSISRLIKEIKSNNMAENVKANESQKTAANVAVQNGYAIRQSRPAPLEEVEADEHNLHGIGCVRIKIDGIEKNIPTERPVGIAIIDRGSKAILGGAICLNSEAKEEALIEAIRSAVIPSYIVRLPSGVQAPLFRPCDIHPELAGAVWTVMHLDNAKIHTGNRYLFAASQMGTQTCFGPLGSWSGRPNIENTFARLVKGHFSHLPSTTGSGSEYAGRTAPAEQAIKWEIEQEDLCRLFFQGLAEINKSVTEGLLQQAPVNYLRNYFKGSDHPMLRRLPPITASNPDLGVQPVRVRVRRRSKDNPNMYINFIGVKYTNALLSARADLIGEFIILHPRPNLRTLPAFELCGLSLGDLVADGHWGATDHTAEIRHAVNADKDLRFGQHGQEKTPIQAMLEKKGHEVAKRYSKRKPGEIVKGGLELARQMEATSTSNIEFESMKASPAKIISAVTTAVAAQRARQARQALHRLGDVTDE